MSEKKKNFFIIIIIFSIDNILGVKVLKSLRASFYRGGHFHRWYFRGLKLRIVCLKIG